MRADRLISLLLLLQRRGHVTTRQVADELEVSARTARRDLEALSMSGVPVYSQAGRNGGWFLLGGATTDLTGLNEPEAKALVLAATTALGADPMLRTALRKLVGALPQSFREAADTATATIISDTGAWGVFGQPGGESRPAHFTTVSDALLTRHQLTIEYLSNQGHRSQRLLNPLGLIEKTGRWYLIAAEGDPNEPKQRTFRVDRIEAARIESEQSIQPDGFDLREQWKVINERFSDHALTVEVEGMARGAEPIPHLKRIVGSRLELGPIDSLDNTPFVVRGWSLNSVARELAAFGDMIEITSPEPVTRLLGEIGSQLAALYPSPTA